MGESILVCDCLFNGELHDDDEEERSVVVSDEDVDGERHDAVCDTFYININLTFIFYHK